jgi:hypothetical protein
MSKWICTIVEGLAGFVIWSFMGWWIGVILATSTETRWIAIPFSTAGTIGLVMAVVYARRGYLAYEGRGKPERTAFGNVYSAMVFVLCALAWGVLIFFMQIPKGGH